MTNSPSPKQQLQDIYQLIRQNNPQEARRLLQQFIKNNPPDADAFYISTFLTSDIQRRIHLCERALQINPNHGPVMQLLEKLQGELAESTDADSPPGFMNDIPAPAARPQAVPTPKFEPTKPPPSPTPEAPAPTPFTDTWGEEQIKAAKASPARNLAKAPAQPNSALLFGLGLVLGLVLAGAAGAYAVSQVSTQPTAAPIVLVVTATDLPELPTSPPIDTATPRPPTRTRPPTFTPIPTRTPLFAARQSQTADARNAPTGSAAQRGTATPATPSALTATDGVQPLLFNVFQAKYSKTLNRIVMIAKDELALHVYDPVTNTDLSIALLRAPSVLSVSPNGNFAAVGHDALISYVDLKEAKVISTFEVTFPVTGILLPGNGWVYSAGANRERLAIELETRRQVEASGSFGVVHPDGRVYWISDNQLVFYDMSDPAKPSLQTKTRLPYPTPIVKSCDPLWIAEDGKRAFTGCATVLRTSPDAELDSNFTGRLEGLQKVSALDVSTTSGKVLAIGKLTDRDAPEDNSLIVYDYATLNTLEVNELPATNVNGSFFATQGKYIFFDQDGINYYVITQVDKTAGAQHEFGIIHWQVGGTVNTGKIPPTKTAVPNAQPEIDVLDFAVSKALYSKPLDRLILTNATPPQVIIYNPADRKQTVISLDRVPTSLALSPDALFAVVGQNNQVAMIDLQRGQVLQTYQTERLVKEVAWAANDFIYAMVKPTQGEQTSMIAFHTKTDTVRRLEKVPAVDGILQAASDGQHLYITTTENSNSTVYRLDLASDGDVTKSTEWTNRTKYPTCWRSWLSDDASRLIMGCGHMFKIATSTAQDLTYNGVLKQSIYPKETMVHLWVADSTAAQVIVALPDPEAIDWVGQPHKEQQLLVFNKASLQFTEALSLPKIGPVGKQSASIGHFVFINAAGDRLYVIMRAENGSGLLNDYGIWSSPLKAN